MSYCEDLSTFLDEINRYCKDNYENTIPKEQKFITGQNFENEKFTKTENLLKI